jgi:hypothetical protein
MLAAAGWAVASPAAKSSAAAAAIIARSAAGGLSVRRAMVAVCFLTSVCGTV